jgi:Uma2 family endonuclease
MEMSSSAPFSDPANTGVIVRHRVPDFSERWVLPEVPVPEAAWHDEAAELFRRLLLAWASRCGRNVAVYRNLAIRMCRERPSVGFDPDVCVVEPAPPSARDLGSVKVWEPGHSVPALTLEVVSKNHPYKDYTEVPDQCAAAGVFELVVFDPKRAGPKAHGGRRLLQIWRREADGSFERVYAGDGPARSEYLGAWLIASDDRRLLRLADDAVGSRSWPTPDEAAVEAERAAREAERAAKEAALARIAELEAALRNR